LVDALDMLSSHPRTLDRVNRSIRLAKVARGGWQFDYRKQFLRNIDGMVFGDDPDQGVVRGRRFLHRGLGFAFQVPNGFSLENQPSEVIAEGPGGSGILFDQGSSRYQGSMRAYIVNVWGRNVTLRDLEPLTVNGMEAATGWTRVRGRGGSADIRVVAIRYDGSHIYRFMFVAPQGSMSRLAHGFKQTTYSFRRLGASEADSIRPWRIRILTLETDRSVRDLARRMAVNSHREDWFRVLNDVGNAQTVPAGRSVKLVV
jgi:predicted Zn-dependent protease